MYKFISEGGPFMWIILGVSVLSLMLIIERYVVLTFSYSHKRRFFEKVISSLKHEDLNTTLKLCRSTGHPLAEVIYHVLKNGNRSNETIESIASVKIQKILPRIQKNTTYIQMMGNVATLLGLLGTIQGLIVSFQSLAQATAATKATLLAQGISVAMNTTAFGLIVAIPCIIAFTYLSNKERTIMQSYDDVLGEVISLVTYDQSVIRKNFPDKEK